MIKIFVLSIFEWLFYTGFTIFLCYYLFVSVDALCHIQQCFSQVGTISCLPGLNQY